MEEERRLERARVRLRAVERIAGVGTWEADIRTDQLRWSANVRRILGLPESVDPDFDLFIRTVHHDDRARLVQAHVAALEGAASYPVEYRIVRPDGSVRHLCEEAVVEVEDGHVIRLLGTMHDITDQTNLTRTLVDTESRRRELLHRMVRASEHERAELAGDIHDGPIQMLTVAAMRLEHLGMVDPHPPAWLPDAVQTVRDTVVQLRDVLVELHPRAGAGAGLDATLTQLALTIVPDLDVEVVVRGDSTDLEGRAVFGIVQEALWDVREGDRTRHLDIGIEVRDGVVDLSLTGGSAAAGATGELLGRAGLLGVRERTEGLGGRCITEQVEGDPVVRCLLPRIGDEVDRG
jgi:PAS domain S-box-containing protein